MNITHQNPGNLFVRLASADAMEQLTFILGQAGPIRCDTALAAAKFRCYDVSEGGLDRCETPRHLPDGLHQGVLCRLAPVPPSLTWQSEAPGR